jgi:hypothetical protein
MIIKSKNGFYYLIPVLLFTLTVPFSCKATRYVRTTETPGNQVLTVPHIIFINYFVRTGKSKAVPEIRLVNKIITEGRLKKNITGSEIPKPGDLLCFALNNNLEPVDSVIIPDPLNITIESVDEKNALFRKEMALDSAQFTLRMQLDEKTRSIGIRTRSNSENRNNYLLITKIVPP